MWTPRLGRTVSILILLCFALLAPAHAQAAPLRRVRTDSPYLRLLITSGLEQSPTFKEIVERLEQSDTIVEVQCGQFAGSLTVGRTVLLSAHPTVRYVLVEVACQATSLPALCAIGHELRHALEIALARWVVDDETMALLYTQIGFPNQVKPFSYGRFETADALDAGSRIHHDLFHQSDLTRGQTPTRRGNDERHVSTGSTAFGY
jgi:hypothetical protein